MSKSPQNITSKTGRSALPVRREPYWSRIEAGGYVGYRKVAEGEGSWIARHRDIEGKQHYRALKDVSGDKAYDEARKAAIEWLKGCNSGVITKGATVGDACRDYVKHLLVQNGKRSARDAEIRFERLVYGARINAVALDRLTADSVRSWVNDQLPKQEDDPDDEAIRRARDTTNRNLASFKAALNLALASKKVGSDAAWKTVVPFENVGRRRDRYLTLTERRALISKCPADLEQLVQGLLLTALRSGELANAKVSDFDDKQGTLNINGKTGSRTVSLSTAARQLFAQATRDRIASAPLLARADGSAWNKDAWKKPFKAAVTDAGLDPDVVTYSLRHTAISDMIGCGMDAFLVAKLAGTSTAMIDKHYGHLRHERMRDMLDQVKLA